MACLALFNFKSRGALILFQGKSAYFRINELAQASCPVAFSGVLNWRGWPARFFFAEQPCFTFDFPTAP
jgi:hypothetical protein